jgi:hypothetical protein
MRSEPLDVACFSVLSSSPFPPLCLTLFNLVGLLAVASFLPVSCLFLLFLFSLVVNPSITPSVIHTDYQMNHLFGILSFSFSKLNSVSLSVPLSYSGCVGKRVGTRLRTRWMRGTAAEIRF